MNYDIRVNNLRRALVEILKVDGADPKIRAVKLIVLKALEMDDRNDAMMPDKVQTNYAADCGSGD